MLLAFFNFGGFHFNCQYHKNKMSAKFKCFKAYLHCPSLFTKNFISAMKLLEGKNKYAHLKIETRLDDR